MILVLVCAVMVTAGVGAVAWATLPRRRSLAVELDELLAVGRPATPESAGFWEVISATVSSMLAGDSAEVRFPQLVKDLAVMGETPAGFARQVVLTGVLFAGLAVAVCAVVTLEGLHVAPGVAVGVVAAVGGLGVAVPRPVLAGQAAERRAEMRDAVAVICDLAAVLVAAGEDIEAALVVAAGAGEGWAFETVRAGLPAGGRVAGWAGLEQLGERLGVGELVVLAQHMGLAAERGARVRDALHSQARMLREQAASEVQAKAGSMTERMSFPMVMLLAGFLVVIGYPAVARL